MLDAKGKHAPQVLHEEFGTKTVQSVHLCHLKPLNINVTTKNTFSVQRQRKRSLLPPVDLWQVCDVLNKKHLQTALPFF